MTGVPAANGKRWRSALSSGRRASGAGLQPSVGVGARRSSSIGLFRLLRATALIALTFLLGKTVQGIRGTAVAVPAAVQWVLDWMPSFAFALGISVAVLTVCAVLRVTWRSAAWCAGGAVIGICLREVWQLWSPGRTFDPWDLLALGVGGTAALALERRAYPESVDPSSADGGQQT